MIVERELVDFFNKIWREQEGVAKLGTRDSDNKWLTSLFTWPQSIAGILDKINQAVADGKDVFYSPDLYKNDAITQKKFTKDLVLGSSVICLDFDGNAPQDDSWYGENGLPLPSMKIQSSSIGNQHVYWIVDEFVTDIDHLENMRRTITYNLKADSSGWDAGQFLRVPYTVNHKFGKSDPHVYDVFIEEDNASDRVYTTSLFPITHDFRPLVAGAIDPNNLPDVVDVLTNNSFIDGFLENFKKVPDPKTRSDALMRVAYDAAESDLSNEEIYSLLLDADSRWNKYTHRKDKHTRYTDIIERAKRKYPHGPVEISITDGVETDYQRVYGFGELYHLTTSITWVFDGLLSEGGYGIFAGPPNIGKTQLAIRFGVACALKKDFIGWKNSSDRPLKVIMYSLEMNRDAIKYFLNKMTDLEPCLEQLTEQFKILPIAELVDFTDTKGQLQQVLHDIETIRPDIVIIDSLSMAVGDSLNDSKTALSFNKQIKIIRKHAECAVIVIHHSKKPQTNKAMSGDMDDLYGSRFITAEADFVITFVPTYDSVEIEDVVQAALSKQSDEKQPTGIRAINSKIRLGPWMPSIDLVRTPTLDFEDKDAIIPGFSEGKHSAGSSPPLGF